MRFSTSGHRRARVRSGAAVAALAVAFSGLVATASPAVAAEPAATKLVVSPSRVTKAIGSGVTFTFTLSTATKRLGGKTIEIYTRPSGTLQWTKRWTKTLDAYGTGRVAWTVQRSTYVKATYAGNTLYAPAKSAASFVSAVDSFGKRVITEAATHRGKPYQWGATGPSRFDCSGFTMYVFGRFGKSLPHNSGQQYNSVRHIARADKKVGDLIFTYNSGGIYHVAIYAGNGEIWHSPRSGDVVKRSPIFSNSYYVGRVG